MKKLAELANKINLLENRSKYGHWSRLSRDRFGDYSYHFVLWDKGDTDNHTKTIYTFSEPLEAEELFEMVKKVLTGQASFEDFVTKFP